MSEERFYGFRGIILLVFILIIFTSGFSLAEERGNIAFVSSKDNQIYTVINGKIEQRTFIPPAIEPALSPDGRYIAYSSFSFAKPNDLPDYEILIKDTKSDKITRLTFDGNNYEPAWSPDGRKIAYNRRDENPQGISDIYVIDVGTKSAVKLTNSDGYYSSPDWSPDGNEIVYYYRPLAQTEISRICVMKADGTSKHRLFESQSWSAEPKWSPTGKYIAYCGGVEFSLRDRFPQIYVVNVANQQAIPVTNDLFEHITPSWSPDGKEIAFTGRTNPALGDNLECDIYTVRLEDSQIVKLTDNRWLESEPTWSPDGKYIAFVRRENRGQSDIYRMTRNGEEITQLTNSAESEALPAWSPNGNQIAFCRDGNIYLMDTDGQHQIQLTNDGKSVFPTWSPDGKQIAYIHREADRYAIIIMDSNGQNGVKVYENPNIQERGLSWSPDGKKLAYFRVAEARMQNNQLRIGLQVCIFNLMSQTEEIPALDVSSPCFVQWSPSGEYYAISARPPLKRPDDGIFIVNRDGTNKRLIFSMSSPDQSIGELCWSPNEQRILFGGKGDLFIVDVNTGQRQLFMNSAHSPDWIDPSWGVSPKGKHIKSWGDIKRSSLNE